MAKPIHGEPPSQYKKKNMNVGPSEPWFLSYGHPEIEENVQHVHLWLQHMMLHVLLHVLYESFQIHSTCTVASPDITDLCSINSRLWRSKQIKHKKFKSGEQPGHAYWPTSSYQVFYKHTVQEFQNCIQKMWHRAITHESYMNPNLQLDILEEFWKTVL